MENKKIKKSKIDKKENKRLWMNWTVQQLFKGYKNVLIIILLFVFVLMLSIICITQHLFHLNSLSWPY